MIMDAYQFLLDQALVDVFHQEVEYLKFFPNSRRNVTRRIYLLERIAALEEWNDLFTFKIA